MVSKLEAVHEYSVRSKDVPSQGSGSDFLFNNYILLVCSCLSHVPLFLSESQDVVGNVLL